MSIDILPNVNSSSRNRDASSAQSAHFRICKVEEQPNKKPKKGGEKSAVALFVNSVRQQGCVSQDTEPPDYVTISRKGTKSFWDQFDEYDSQELRCVKQTSEKAKVHR